MKPEFIELAKYRIVKAKETIADARIYYENASSASTVNRIYYAMFYAVNALLITAGKFSAKHAGVRSLLNREFVKTGIVDVEAGKFYSEMFDTRQEGDYKDFMSFNKEDIAVWLEKAEGFIEAMETIVRERMKE